MQLIGILNITNDSFSDGGKFLNIENAVAHTKKNLINEQRPYSQQWIEIGAASSNIHSSVVDEKEELQRIQTYLQHPEIIQLKKKGVKFGIDSFKPQVQKKMLQVGIDFINDIQSFSHPEIYPTLAESSVPLIMMYSSTLDKNGFAQEQHTSDFQIIFNNMIRFFEQKINLLTQYGIEKKRFILDPGMGNFLSSNPDISYQMIHHIPLIKQHFNLPIYIGVSRKSFLITNEMKQLDKNSTEFQNLLRLQTKKVEQLSISKGADYIRTHEII